MATNTFTSYAYKDVGTSAATIFTNTSPNQTTVIGLTCANTTSSPVTVDVYVTRSAVNYYIVKTATVPVGGSLVVVGGDQKLVLQGTDALKVVSSAASSVDVLASMLVIS